nr:HAMP domain-containing sensor histidine kinase [Pseudofrankia saprophytica]
MAMLVGAAVLAGIAVVAGVALGATNVVLRNSIDDQLRQQVNVAGDNIKLWYVEGPDPNSLEDDRIQIYANPLGLRMQVFWPNGTILGPSNPTDYVQLPVDGADIAVSQAQDDQLRLRTVKVDGNEYRVATVALRITSKNFANSPFPSDYQMTPNRLGLQLARPMSDVTSTLGELGLVMLVVGIVGVGGSTVAGLLVARAALRPVDATAAAAEHVARTQDLSALIPVTGTDEIARLAGSLNSMLRALAASKARQRQLVDDASHELRTPLTSLRTNIELLIRSEANPHRALPAADRADLLRDVDGQTRELTGLVSELVELARDEAPVEEVERLDLAEVVAAAVARARRRAAPKGIVIEVASAASWVDGRPNMLERAVTNLLDNAVKFSPADSTVRVETAAGEVIVSDEGPGISSEDRPHVFERFYRSTDARSLPGSGLGLAIVADAVHTHGGTVTAGEAPGGGARMRMWLPLAAPPETQPGPLWDGPRAQPGEPWAAPEPDLLPERPPETPSPVAPSPVAPSPGAPNPVSPSPASPRARDTPGRPDPRDPDDEAVRRAYLGFTAAGRPDPHSPGGGADAEP